MCRTKGPVPTERACTDCHVVYACTLEHFCKNPTCVGGLSPQCRGCTRIRKRESQLRGRARVLAVRRRQERRPLREGEICPACHGLSHRVIEGQCWRCGLDYAPEPPVDVRDYLYQHPERVTA